jgi:hypothetical protein
MHDLGRCRSKSSPHSSRNKFLSRRAGRCCRCSMRGTSSPGLIMFTASSWSLLRPRQHHLPSTREPLQAASSAKHQRTLLRSTTGSGEASVRMLVRFHRAFITPSKSNPHPCTQSAGSTGQQQRPPVLPPDAPNATSGIFPLPPARLLCQTLVDGTPGPRWTPPTCPILAQNTPPLVF